jgi:uncharacterized protein YjbI with pentapeptide repeats
LPHANLTWSNLGPVDLKQADGRSTGRLWRTNLEGADLRSADLTGANLTSARLGNARLAGAILVRAVTTDTPLAAAMGSNAAGRWQLGFGEAINA